MRALFKFFLLTFLLSWLLWIVPAVVLRTMQPPSGILAVASFSLYLIGVFAPAIVALALTARAKGRAGTQALLARTVKWSVGARWYLFALGYMAAIKIAVALLLRIATGAWPAFGREAAYLMVIAIPFSTPVQAGEEIGWRGYALPRLSARLGLGGAGIA